MLPERNLEGWKACPGGHGTLVWIGNCIAVWKGLHSPLTVPEAWLSVCVAGGLPWEVAFERTLEDETLLARCAKRGEETRELRLHQRAWRCCTRLQEELGARAEDSIVIPEWREVSTHSNNSESFMLLVWVLFWCSWYCAKCFTYTVFI